MKRDELRELLQGLRSVAYDAGEARFVKRAENAIAWLERLPAGCELVGYTESSWHPDASQIHGLDDLTKAGNAEKCHWCGEKDHVGVCLEAGKR